MHFNYYYPYNAAVPKGPAFSFLNYYQNPPDFAYFKLIRAFRFEKAHVTSRHKNGVLGMASVIATTKKEPFAA